MKNKKIIDNEEIKTFKFFELVNKVTIRKKTDSKLIEWFSGYINKKCKIIIK